MNLPLTPGDLTRPEWDQFQAALDQFESAWDGADDVDLLPFLPRRGDRLRLVYLYEFVKTDLEMRWRRGQRPQVENYLKRFLELKEHPSELAKLLAEEYRAREFGGDNPPFSDYQQRFPELFAEFCQLVGAPSKTSVGSGTLKPGPRKKATSPPSPPPLTDGGEESSLRKKSTAPAIPPGTPMSATIPYPPSATPGPGWSDGVLPVGGGYKLIRRLGAGQFGEVWLAEAPGGVEVAIKIIRRGLGQEAAQRELQALEATKRLRHTYLLQLQAYWSLEDRLIIAMELADGTLTDELKKHNGQGMPAAGLLRHMEEAAEVLDFLHQQQVVHRDVKPENILLLRGHVKLADLGLARLMVETSFTGTSCGSPAYMAPEVWQGRAGQLSDQYSLAASYVQMRLNRSLFPGKDMYGIMLAHLREPPDLSGLPEPERKVLLKALAKDPKQRFPTCTGFVQALRSASTPREPRTQTTTPHQPGGLFWTVVIAILVVVVGLAGTSPFWVPALFPSTDRNATGANSTEIESTDTKPWLPEGYVPSENAQRETIDGKTYYSHIVYQGANVPREYATFILVKPPPGNTIKQPDGSPIRPFYMMEHKVSNRLFRAVIDANPEKRPGGWPRKETWRLGAQSVDGKTDLPGAYAENLEGDHLNFPVFRVRVDDAEDFAHLMGGRLPTAEEWWIAAGFSLPPKNGGPFEGTTEWELGDFALRKTDPTRGGAMPIGKARRDKHCVESVSESCVKYCYDMASNGYEWTATTVTEENSVTGRVNFKVKQGDELIRTLGSSYNDLYPLTYANIAGYATYAPRFDTLLPELKYSISFRVIVEIAP